MTVRFYIQRIDMKKLRLLLAAAVSVLLAASCQNSGDDKLELDPVSATFRFVASEDIQALYEIKMYWNYDEGKESSVNISCKDDLDDSFKVSSVNPMKYLFRACHFSVGSFTRTTTIKYRLVLKRKSSVAIDPEKKYDIAFGQDLVTYDGNKVSPTENMMFASQGMKGERVESYVDNIREFYEEDKYAEIGF